MSRQDRLDRREAAQTEPEGYGGSLSCRSQVEAGLQILREKIGQNIPIRFSWDRTGKQEFPVPMDGTKPNWPAIDIFGASGRFAISAKGAPLPIDAVGFGYRVDGDDISIDLDSVTFKGLAKRLNPSADSMSSSPMGDTPAGFDPVTIAWSLFSIVQIIVGLLNPHLSVCMGGNVAAEAILAGDKLTIKFSECPSVKLVAYWTFLLSVPSIEVVPEKATVFLNGSGLVGSRIKSREFPFE